MVFARIWHMLGGRRRRPTSAQMFRQAQRLRDEGRFERSGRQPLTTIRIGVGLNPLAGL